MAPRSPAPEAVQRLRDALNDLYLDRGKPDLRQLEEVVEMQQRHRTISRTTIGKILKCDPCPSKEQVLAVSGRSAATWPGSPALERHPRSWSAVSASGAPRTAGTMRWAPDVTRAGATVDAEIRVEGFVHAVPPGHHIWIANQDRRGLFWAKEFEVTLDDDGHFERYVAEGGSSPGLMVLLLLASESGHAQLVDWIAESSRSGRYPGIPPSPTRFYVLDQVEIRLDRSTV